LIGITDEFAEGHLGHVPFAVLDEPVEDFLNRQDESRKQNSLRAHRTAREIAHVIVIGRGEGQVQARGTCSFDEFGLAVGIRGCG
jgi:hypothetical protein